MHNERESSTNRRGGLPEARKVGKRTCLDGAMRKSRRTGTGVRLELIDKAARGAILQRLLGKPTARRTVNGNVELGSRVARSGRINGTSPWEL